jgi:hypothetical protein
LVSPSDWTPRPAGGPRPFRQYLIESEFLRRFLLHVLPRGFMRIRHYGITTNRHRDGKLAPARAARPATAFPAASG